jgi:hypothetical protein
MRALSYRTFWLFDGRRMSLGYLSARCRYIYGPARAVKEVTS